MIQIEFPENSQENTPKKSEAKSKNLSKEKQILKTHDNHLLDLVFWWETFVIRVTFFWFIPHSNRSFWMWAENVKNLGLEQTNIRFFYKFYFRVFNKLMTIYFNFFRNETRYCNNSVLVCFRVFGWDRFFKFLENRWTFGVLIDHLDWSFQTWPL